jgi:hypothetical protein
VIEAYKDTSAPKGLLTFELETFRKLSLSIPAPRCCKPYTLLPDIQLAGLKRLYSFIMSSLILYLSATVLFAQSTVASNCTKAPIYVDIHKRAVHDSSIFQYGSFIGLGTPAQNQSLWPSLQQNHTSFARDTYCKDNSTLKNCDKDTGGFFSTQDSTSYVKLRKQITSTVTDNMDQLRRD